MAEEIVVTTKEGSPPANSPLKRRAVEGSLGILAGIVIACLNGPWLVSRLYTPLSSDAASVSCGGPVTNALDYFVKLQLVSGILGGAFILIVSFLLRRMWRKRQAGRAAQGA